MQPEKERPQLQRSNDANITTPDAAHTCIGAEVELSVEGACIAQRDIRRSCSTQIVEEALLIEAADLIAVINLSLVLRLVQADTTGDHQLCGHLNGVAVVRIV